MTLQCTSPTILLQKEYRWANVRREVFAFGKTLELKNVTNIHIIIFCEILGIMPNTEPPSQVRYVYVRGINVRCKYFIFGLSMYG